MKKIVIGGVVLLLASSVLVYLWPKQPPDDVLVRMGGILSELEAIYDGRSIRIMPFSTRPGNLDEERVGRIRDKMRKAGFISISLSCSSSGCLSSYNIDRGFLVLGNYMYYKYVSDNLLEEIIVDSVENAIEENTEVIYAFCERTEVEHWFYCENNH